MTFQRSIPYKIQTQICTWMPPYGSRTQEEIKDEDCKVQEFAHRRPRALVEKIYRRKLWSHRSQSGTLISWKSNSLNRTSSTHAKCLKHSNHNYNESSTLQDWHITRYSTSLLITRSKCKSIIRSRWTKLKALSRRRQREQSAKEEGPTPESYGIEHIGLRKDRSKNNQPHGVICEVAWSQKIQICRFETWKCQWVEQHFQKPKLLNKQRRRTFRFKRMSLMGFQNKIKSKQRNKTSSAPWALKPQKQLRLMEFSVSTGDAETTAFNRKRCRCRRKIRSCTRKMRGPAQKSARILRMHTAQEMAKARN